MRFGNKVRMRHNSSCFQNFSTLRAKTKITFHTLFCRLSQHSLQLPNNNPHRLRQVPPGIPPNNESHVVCLGTRRKRSTKNSSHRQLCYKSQLKRPFMGSQKSKYNRSWYRWSPNISAAQLSQSNMGTQLVETPCVVYCVEFLFFFYNGFGVPFWITQLLHKTKRAWRESQKKLCIFTLSNLNHRLEYRVNCRRLEEKFSRFIQKMSAKVLHKLIQFNNNVF